MNSMDELDELLDSMSNWDVPYGKIPKFMFECNEPTPDQANQLTEDIWLVKNDNDVWIDLGWFPDGVSTGAFRIEAYSGKKFRYVERLTTRDCRQAIQMLKDMVRKYEYALI